MRNEGTETRADRRGEGFGAWQMAEGGAKGGAGLSLSLELSPGG